jgi:hypothetical protein
LSLLCTSQSRALTDSPGSRPLLLRPQRLPSPNQIHDDDDAKLFSRSHDDTADCLGAPISSSSSSERDDRVIGANYAYDPDVLRARASRGSSSLGSSSAVCSISKSLHWTWKSDDARPADEAGGDDDDADTKPPMPTSSSRSSTRQNQQSSPRHCHCC